MKKGTFFTNLFVLISVGCMYSIVLYLGYMDISTYISLGTLTVISVVLFWACFTGLNKISQITGCLKKVRKNILNLHVKDPEFVWEAIREEKFIFKNSILDGEFNNFKKEMNRLEDEGSIYCQADMADYINEDTIFVNVKKRVLDSVAFILSMIGIVGVLISLSHAMGIFQYSSSVKVVMQCLKPIIIMLAYTIFTTVLYTYIYKIIVTNMCKEYRLFIGDFYKYVVPSAKNDMANNILYLQQIQMQNTEKLSENVVELLSDKINETMIRQSEKFTELSRQIESMTTTINRFNTGVDEFNINIKDMMENDKLLSKEQNKVVVDCFEKLEQDGIKVNGSLVQEVDLDNKVEANAENTEEVVENVEAEAKKTTKKTTTKKAATKKTTSKKTTAKKEAEKEVEKEDVKKETTKKETTKKTTKRTTKKAKEQDTKALSDIAEKRIKAAAMKIAEASSSLGTKEDDTVEEAKENVTEDTVDENNKSSEVVVDIAPVKKRRGRKTKAEKEAELKAALELAKKAQEEIKAKTIEEEKAAEEAKEEIEVKEEPKAEETKEEIEVKEEPKAEETKEEIEVKEEPKIEEKIEVAEEKAESNVIAFRTENNKIEDVIEPDSSVEEVIEIKVES